jgi:hypothetical protein
MAVENGTTIDGVVKRIYEDNIKELLPDFAILMKRVPFKSRKKIGELLQVPVRLRHAHGHTVDSGANMDAFTMNAAIPGQTKGAQVTSMPYALRDQISTTLLSRTETNEQAIRDAMDVVVPDLTASASWYHEMCWLYGGTNVAAIASLSGAGTSRAWVIAAADFAPGLWVNAENAEFDVYDPTLVTKRNTNAAVVLGAVDPDTRTLNVTGNAADLTASLANDVLVPRGANGVWFAGLNKIATNTGTLFNISAATYAMWKSSSVSVGGAMTFAKLVSGAAKSVVRSGPSKLAALVNTYTWTDLMVNEAALRRHLDKTGVGFENGGDSLTFYGPNGSIEMIPHPMIKGGDGFLVDLKTLSRVGSSDLTLAWPGANQGVFVHPLENVTAQEVRMWSDQAAFCHQPNRIVKFTGIANVAGA